MMSSLASKIVGTVNALDKPKMRIYSLAYIDGISFGALDVLVGVFVAERFGIFAAGLVFGFGALSRALSPFLFTWMEKKRFGSDATHKIFRLLIVILVLSSILSAVAAAWFSMWIIIPSFLLWSIMHSSTSTISLSVSPRMIVGYGPFMMVGAATGALVGTFLLQFGRQENPYVAVSCAILVLVFPLLAPLLIRFAKFHTFHSSHFGDVIRYVAKGFLLALFTYGPLFIYQALTIQVASPSWVGWAMVVYAAGALLAPVVKNRVWFPRTYRGILVLGVFGVATWGFAFSGPLILVGRFISALTLFVAEGTLLQSSFKGNEGEKVSTLRMSGALTGLEIGGAVSAIMAAGIVEKSSVPTMGIILAGVLAIITLGFAAGQYLKSKKDERIVHKKQLHESTSLKRGI